MKPLQEFEELPLQHLFQTDFSLHKTLSSLIDGAEKERLQSVLQRWEQNILRWNALACEAARPEKLPRLQKYDIVGNRVEKVILPLKTQTIRREVVEQGIWESRTEMEKFAKIYLLAQIGESGVTCPLACTDGLIRVLEAQGSDFLRKKFLPLLRSAEFPLAGAQFITERAGGSDVGAIEGKALPQEDGTWKINALKWYSSAADEFFLVAARPEGAPEGTKGIAIFLVPRVLEKGQPNFLSYRRLKDKLGTQSLPTAEIDFEGSIAWPIGKTEDGFHHLMNYVLNCSRIHNAANSLGLLRRAFVEARNYACQRVAFGREIIHYPLVQESLLSILTHLTSRQTLFFTMLKRLDQDGLLPTDREGRYWQRFLINLMKYRTATSLTEKVKDAILVFGANGILNDFSILPRLLKDSLIIETWEGTHNTLCLQILRDGTRFNFLGRLETEMQDILSHWPEEILSQSLAKYRTAFQKLKEILTPQHFTDPTWAQTHARRVVDGVANLLEIGTLVKQGASQKHNGLLLQAAHLTHSSFGDFFAGFDNPVLQKLSLFGLDLIHEKSPEVSVGDF